MKKGFEMDFSSAVRNQPRLYKRTSTGATQFWDIWVEHYLSHSNIITRYGQVGTDNPQLTTDRITSGKNLGRSNATTIEEQAEAEARSRWEKQVKKGYVESQEKAEAGETELEFHFSPMLAHSYDEHGHKIKFPAIIQPKLDGIRCLALVTPTGVELYSRTRKRITGMKHVEHDLYEVFFKSMGMEGLILDGELYNHGMRDNFEAIVSAVRKEEFNPETAHLVEYHVYDVFLPARKDASATDRQQWLDSVWDNDSLGSIMGDYVKRVPTGFVMSEKEMRVQFDKSLEAGYEGMMLRNFDAPYQNKRSYGLQKVKEFKEDEFEIVGVREGRGKMAGKGIFVCKTEDGTEFDCKLAGDMDYLKVVWECRDSFVGKKLTVQYQGISNTNKVPRFPVGKAVRDYE